MIGSRLWTLRSRLHINYVIGFQQTLPISMHLAHLSGLISSMLITETSGMIMTGHRLRDGMIPGSESSHEGRENESCRP